MKPVQQSLISKIKSSILQALENGAEPIAAFDADGTLWANDLGEDFFKFQLKNNHLNHLPENPWAYYKSLYENQKSTDEALTWLARVNSGKSMDQFRQWTKDYVYQNPPPFLHVQKELIEFMKQLSVEIFVVTASVKWVVEAGAEILGLPLDHVLGVETKVVDGLITDEIVHPITWREGKVKGLMLKTNNKPPFFVSGNSTGDLALLESSTHIRWTQHSALPDDDVFESERKLLKIAKDKDWFFHDYHS